jgi:hypothetical protein
MCRGVSLQIKKPILQNSSVTTLVGRNHRFATLNHANIIEAQKCRRNEHAKNKNQHELPGSHPLESP